MRKVIAFVVTFAIIGVWFVLPESYIRVKPRQRAVKSEWGKIVEKTYGPGLVFQIPFTEALGNQIWVVETQPQRYPYTLDVRTADKQKVNIEVSVLCTINDINLYKMFDKYNNYDEYEEKVIKDMVNQTMLSICSSISSWSFIGNYMTMVTEAVNYICNDALLEEQLVKIDAVRLGKITFSKEYEKLIEETVLAQQSIELETYKVEKARIETQRVLEEARQTYEKMAAIARAKGLEIQIKAEALKNPYVAQYEMAKAFQKWNGQIPSLPESLTLMGTANAGGMPILPMLPTMNIGNNKK